MLYTLENDMAVVKVDTHAAELASFKRKDKNIEYMWSGDPKYWANRNPILFPHVSATSNKILNFKGKDYRVNNHGFARNSEFSVEEVSDDYIILKLSDNEETLSQYPYRFDLYVRYTLKSNKLYIDYQIDNKENGPLYFGFGQHPAFNCPLDSDKKFADYFIEFDREDVEGYRLNLSYDLFERYPTYRIDNPESSTFTLSDGDNKVIMNVDDKYRIFAVWTPMAPFICLEPWVDAIDPKDIDTPFEQRDVICLNKGENYRIGYSIEIV